MKDLLPRGEYLRAGDSPWLELRSLKALNLEISLGPGIKPIKPIINTHWAELPISGQW